MKSVYLIYAQTDAETVWTQQEAVIGAETVVLGLINAETHARDAELVVFWNKVHQKFWHLLCAEVSMHKSVLKQWIIYLF